MTPLARELKRQGLTVTELAQKSGVNRAYLYLIKDGHRRAPSWKCVARISRALNVDPVILFPPYGR